MGEEEDEEAAPPPPPPTPPPPPPILPPPDATTIGKYIARFRYELPRPREQRAAVQKGDFWWTLSPRYARVGARSPSPPSSWASGSAFDFPDDDESAEESKEGQQGEEKETDGERGQDEELESRSSLERKLRRRLGTSSSGTDASEKTGGMRVLTSAEARTSWDIFEWNSLALEEAAIDSDHELVDEEEVEMEDEDEEDPEEVIDRVRRRLGWGSSSLSSPSSYSLGSRSSVYRLPLSTSEKQRNEQHRLPPLSPVKSLRWESGSPGSFEGDGSTCNWGSPVGMIESDGQTEVALLSTGGSSVVNDCAPPVEQKEADGEKVERETTSHENTESHTAFDEDAALLESSNAQCGYTDDVPAATTSAKSSAGVFHQRQSKTTEIPQESDSQLQSSFTDDPQGMIEPQSPANLPEMGLMNGADEVEHKDQQEGPALLSGQQVSALDGHAADLPSLPAANPVPFASTCTSPGSRLLSRAVTNSSSSIKQAAGETSATLDHLLSFVVHSWSEEFFNSAESQAEPIMDDMQGKCGSEYGDADAEIKGKSSEKGATAQGGMTTTGLENEQVDAAERRGTKDTVHDTPEPPLNHVAPNAGSTSSLEIAAPGSGAAVEVTGLGSGARENSADEEVPGEEHDEIIRLLLDRIALFEEALRYISD